MEDLAAAALRTRSEKLKWQALGDARHVLDLVQECAIVNSRWAEILNRGQWITWPQEKINEELSRMGSLDLALARLRQGTDEFCNAVRSVPVEKFGESLELPWAVVSMSEAMLHAVWHMSYHEGQVNYIQTLYGDWTE